MKKQNLLEELKSEGFSKKIINAFSKIKRENFVPEKLKKYAYLNEPLPIGLGSTISQPYTIAFMLDLLELEELSKNPSILEIGSGSGYVLALINEILKSKKNKDYRIYGVEISPDLVYKSKKILKNKNISIFEGNGIYGLKSKMPFDRILISTAFDNVPNNLFKQLKNNGILVVPIKDSIYQFRKLDNKIESHEFPGFVFVPVKR